MLDQGVFLGWRKARVQGEEWVKVLSRRVKGVEVQLRGELGGHRRRHDGRDERYADSIVYICR